jgi:hypothetical protein
MMMPNLGGFGGQLQLGDLNGALKNAGSEYQIPEVPETQLQMPAGNGGPSVAAAPEPVATPEQPPPQAQDLEKPGGGMTGFDAARDTISSGPLKGVINLQTIGTLVGSYFGGPMGGQIGGAIGGMAKNNVDKQKASGGLR